MTKEERRNAINADKNGKPIFDATATTLMACSARDLVKELEDKPELIHARMKACDHFLNGEIVQIHVMVVRNENDFLDDFQIELMEGWQPTND